MKITYLQLKNYASIYVSMHKKKIEIDFTKAKNNIILLVGKNGSGKTSILSALHPFAYPGNMDVRNNTNLILDGEDGYKEIHIQYDDKLYKIQHYYKYSKKQVSVKSFIQRNGEELNPNGNVRSFNETVKIELSIEQDYLKLLRLGSNVTNLIEMKAAERKNFTSDLLSDINIYNELYKKVSEDSKLLKNLIKSVGDKINKLNVVDVDLLTDSINKSEKSLKILSNRREELQNNLGQLDGKISVLIPEGIDMVDENISTLKSDIKIIESDIVKYKKARGSYVTILSDDIDDYINGIDLRINGLKNELETQSTMSSFYKDRLNELYNRRDELLEKLRYFTSDLEYAQLTSLQIELTNKHNQYSKKFSKHIPKDSKDNMLVILGILTEMNNIAHTIYEFDHMAITEFINLIKERINVEDFVKEEIKKIDKKLSSLGAKFDTEFVKNNVTVLFRPNGCTFDNCPYLDLYKRMYSPTENSDDGSFSSLQARRENLEMLININRNYEYILMILKSNSALISKSNISYFTIDSIIQSLENRGDIYNESILTEYISDIEEYEEYLSIGNKLKEISYEISLLNANKSNIDTVQSELSKVNSDITDTERLISEFEAAQKTITADIERHNEFYSDAITVKEIENQLSNLNEDLNHNIKELSDMLSKRKNVEGIIIEKADINKSLASVNWDIEHLEKEIFEKRFALKEFENLSKERDILNTKFDDVNVIRESLSSNKGIPLLFIQLYLKNSRMYVNQLLEMVYGDEFEIDDFEINSTEFNIPYIKNGIRINDVVYASQGERSFLSLALSFALINQSIKDYNILLLDEIDSTLDIRNRSLFLSILEKQMDVIDSEQIFLITHNNMFDNYPVDIILTSDTGLDNYRNANIIFSV